MAFSGLQDLSLLAYANGFSLWVYKNTNNDVVTAIDAANYFAAATDRLKVGDVILIQSVNAAVNTGGVIIVKNNDGAGTIDCFDGISHSAADTD